MGGPYGLGRCGTHIGWLGYLRLLRCAVRVSCSDPGLRQSDEHLGDELPMTWRRGRVASLFMPVVPRRATEQQVGMR